MHRTLVTFVLSYFQQSEVIDGINKSKGKL